MSMSAPLEAEGLSVGFRHHRGIRRVVGDVSLSLSGNRIVGLAGESGCGKSTLALALAAYRLPGAVLLGGSVTFEGMSLFDTPPDRLRRLWGARIAYLPQDTSTALNPALRIRRQLLETLNIHRGLHGSPAVVCATELLERVDIPDPERALHRYPHEFSGGQQQRIALALALAGDPQVLILDEPTTGLDVTTQARMNRLIAELVRETGAATLYVSHNLSLLATLCDDLAIMYGGQIIEYGPAEEVYRLPRHPYTAALIRAVPRIDRDRRPSGIPGIPPPTVIEDRCAFADRCAYRAEVCMKPIALQPVGVRRVVRCVRVNEIPAELTSGRDRADDDNARIRGLGSGRADLLQVNDLRCTYRQRGHETVAVDGVSLSVPDGWTLGIAGESGSGKSTLLRTIVGLVRPAGGDISLRGVTLAPTAARRPSELRRAIQIVFQNPDSTLNPRQTVFQVLQRPLKLFRPEVARREQRDVVLEVVESMRLAPRILDRYPRHLSGGQRQRVALARALIAEPDVVLCDEVTSALDVSVQATIIELLIQLRERRQTAIVFVTHDLGVLRGIADEVAIMENGVIRETGPTGQVFGAPQHPYTRKLLDSVPDPSVRETYSSRPNQAKAVSPLFSEHPKEGFL
jgi:oligopeptide/dipeptide ABC transporter ATP-binding protein